MSERQETTHLERLLGLALLILPVLFNTVLLSPELIVGTYPVNDQAFHLAASVRAAEALTSGENPLDCWLGDFGGGYPLLRAYAPLPHLVTGLAIRLAAPLSDAASTFLSIHYILLCLLPFAFFALARSFEFGWLASGASAALSVTLSGSGDFGRFGAGYGAQIWRGSGLYSQLWGLFFGLLALALFQWSLRTGKCRMLAGIGLGIVCLSHLVFAYVVLASAVIVACANTRTPWRSRFTSIFYPFTVCGLMSAFFVIPLILDREWVNISRWEALWKWDSFGAQTIWKELISGNLLDAGRFPILTFLLLCGAGVALWRSLSDRRPQVPLLLAVFWLLLFFGRTTWGYLMTGLGVPDGMHIHRFQAAFEIFAILLAAQGAEFIFRVLRPELDWRRLSAASVIALLVFGHLYLDRTRYVQQSTSWGLENLVANRNESRDFEPILKRLESLLETSPGRVYAGLASGWGATFRAGNTPVFAMLAVHRIPCVSFLYHSLSMMSDSVVLLDERYTEDLALFGVRYVLSPKSWTPPPNVKIVMVSGNYMLSEVPGGGLFAPIHVPYAYRGNSRNWFEPTKDWLRHPARWVGQHVALYRDDPPQNIYRRVLNRWDPIPAPQPGDAPSSGRVLNEWREGENYYANLWFPQAGALLFKAGFHPGLRANINGTVVDPVAVTPGMTAFPVPAGQYQIRVYYEPGRLKSFLFFLGWIGLFLLASFVHSGELTRTAVALRARAEHAAEGITSALSEFGGKIGSFKRRHGPAIVLTLCMAALALRPCYRGLFFTGHDALEYPPRLVEFHESVKVGNLFPIWAKDLGNGYGQPLFEFVPPFFYWIAELFHSFGARIGDSIQFAALLLGMFAALAMYGIGVKVGSRTAGVVMAGAYLFLPYFLVNLYVRGNFMEYSAMTLLPVALWLIWRSIDDDKFRRVPAGCAGVAAFLLCHNVISMLGLPLLVAAGLAIIGFRARVSKWTSSENGALLRLALTLAGGIALAAWFIFPALIEMSYVHTSRLREGYLHFSNHFVTFRQLIFWPWGYGLSVPGEADQMSFMIGPVHLLIAAAGLVAVWRSGTLFAMQKRLSAVLAIAGLSAAFLTTELSRPVWNSLQLLQYAEFPWRALSVAGFCVSILCGIWLLAVPTGRPRIWAAFLSLTILILFNLPNAQPSGFVRFDDEYYAPANIARLGMNTSTREEYEPAIVKRRAEYSIDAMESLSCPFTFRYSPTVEQPELRLFQVQSPSLCRVRVNLLNYPGWMIRLDGKSVTTLTEPEHGRILLDVPTGEHLLSIELTNTLTRQVSRLISLMTLISLMWLKWKTRRKGNVLEETLKQSRQPLIDRPLCPTEEDGMTERESHGAE